MPPRPRILIHLDHNPHPRVFDQIMSLDGGADQILAHGDVDPQDVPLLVNGALYSRGRDELSRTAILVSGTNDSVIEEMVRLARRSFFGPYRVSLMSECKGGSAVAAATVARIGQLVDLPASRAVVIGGGPVGSRAAGILARAGADVTLTAFDAVEAEERAAFLDRVFRVKLEPVVWKSGDPLEGLLEGANVVVTAGPAGLLLLPRAVWSSLPGLELLADVSGAEPSGIEGLLGEEDGDAIDEPGGVRGLGGLAIGRYKIQVHREAVSRLFAREAVVLGPLEIARLAEEILAS